jgi:hypothetical protein
MTAQLDSDALRLVALAEELELGLGSLVRAGRDAEVSGTVRVSLSEGFVRPLVKLDIETMPPPVEVFLAFRRDAGKTSRVRVVAREIEADARRLLR